MMASMVANMEAMRVQLEESEGKQRNDGGQFSPLPRNQQQDRGYFNGLGRGRGRSVARGDRTSYRGDKYCHMHGNCAHTGRECETPANSHKQTTMFSNMVSVSDKNCD